MNMPKFSGAEEFTIIDPARIPDMCASLVTQRGYALISMFANDERKLTSIAGGGGFALYYIFADRAHGQLLTLKAPLGGETFPSIAAAVHAASAYEREIRDMFGLTPLGHPDPKRLVHHANWPEGVHPLRKDRPRGAKPPLASVEPRFRRVAGEGVFEIPVGPVHAGIIEPGHFRFSAAGEPVINLEAQLYFVHKGIEKLCEGESAEKCLYISERISGDETFANSLAYCRAVERIAGVSVPARAAYTRVVFAELERLTSHLGDLAGICLDTAFGFAAFQFRMMRGWAYQVADTLCGMRFLRSVNRPGGVRRDFCAGKAENVIAQLRRIKSELADTQKIITGNAMFIDRVENTGVLSAETAADLNAVGPGGRASGMRGDVRRDFPYEAYGQLEFTVPEHNGGDVNCRMKVKLEECFQAIGLMEQVLLAMPEGPVSAEIGPLPEYAFAAGMVEAPRGEDVIWVMTGEGGRVYRLKVRTPSFCNWPALCHAVRGNVVPDFPLINKSFNLSYAGNDL